MPRLKVTIGDEEFLGTDVKKVPESKEELLELLKELIEFVESPVVIDSELR